MEKRVILILALMLIAVNSYNLYEHRDSLHLVPITGMQSSNGTAYVGVYVIAGGVNAPFDFNVTKNQDNFSADLKWTNVSDAQYYEVYHSSNITSIYYLNVSNLSSDVTNVTGITDTNWTDFNSNTVKRRYYKVASVNGESRNATNETGFVFNLNFTAGSPRTWSLPGLPINMTTDYNIVPAQGFDSVNPDKIRYFFGSNQQEVSAWYGGYGWFALTSQGVQVLAEGQGYYMYPVNNTYNNSIFGMVVSLEKNATFNFTAGAPKTFGVTSPYKYNISTSLYPAQGFDSVNPDKIRYFFGSNQQEVSAWYGGYGWFALTANGVPFLEPGVAYYMYPVNNSYNSSFNLSAGVEP